MSKAASQTWRICELGDVTERIEGGGTPTRAVPEFWAGNIPWVTVKDLKKVRLSSAEESISEFGLKESSSRLIPKNTLIIATRMALGKAVVFDKDVAINQDLKAVFPTKDIEPEYLLHWYLSKSEYIQSMGTGSTVKGIRLDDLRLIPIKVPPLPEQQKIAVILTSVDEVIESTQAQINKLKDLKTGMMQELLTKGIGHSEFKGSPVGRIPKAWKITSFDKVAIKIQDGTHFSPKTKEGECLYITSKNIQNGKLDLRNIQYISQAEHDEIYRRCNVKFGDVLLTKDGANTGNCAMNTLFQPFSLLSSVALLRCDESICLNSFLYQYILSMTCQKQIADSMTGNAITRLTLTIIKGLRIVLPSVTEQIQIVKSLNSIDDQILQKEVKLKSLVNLKKALMQDLLTGKVRVKVSSR